MCCGVQESEKGTKVLASFTIDLKDYAKPQDMGSRLERERGREGEGEGGREGEREGERGRESVCVINSEWCC